MWWAPHHWRKCGVLHGQLSDEGGQTGVVRVLGSFHAQLRDGGAGDVLPVRIQRPHRGISEKNPRVVSFLLRNVRVIGHQGGGQGIPRENVHAAAQDNGRRAAITASQRP